MPCAKCLDLEEVINQEQLIANNSIELQDHPLMGSMRVMKSPPRFGSEILEPGSPSPAHGQHTDDVLASFNLDAAQIQSLKADGVVL